MPVQEAAHAAAEDSSFGMIVLYVEGTSRAVYASQETVRPLKRTSLLLQISRGSQVTSSITSLWMKNVLKVESSRPLTAVSHSGSPVYNTRISLDPTVVTAGRGRGTHIVIQIRSTHQVRAIVVGPLNIARRGTIIRRIRRIGDEPRLVIQQRRRERPVPDLLRPVQILGVIGVSGQPCSQLEQSTIRHRVLHRIPGLIDEDLPAQSATTAGHVPSRLLGIEHTLCEREPGEFALAIGEFQLGGRHGGEAPEHLVVVSLSSLIFGSRMVVLDTHEVTTVVGGHVIPIRTRLPFQSHTQFIVVCGVAGEMPVIQQRKEQR